MLKVDKITIRNNGGNPCDFYVGTSERLTVVLEPGQEFVIEVPDNDSLEVLVNIPS